MGNTTKPGAGRCPRVVLSAVGILTQYQLWQYRRAVPSFREHGRFARIHTCYHARTCEEELNHLYLMRKTKDCQGSGLPSGPSTARAPILHHERARRRDAFAIIQEVLHDGTVFLSAPI
jgi:hypothetical protein